MTNVRILYLSMSILIFSCQSPATEEKASNQVAVDTISLKQHIKTLASDDFMGRKPFTVGEEKTLMYLENQFKGMGLEPGNGESYFQEVPMVELTARPSKKMVVKNEGSEVELEAGDDFVAYTERVQETVELKDVEMVFAGFGIVAPEYSWNDYEGIDVKDKIVVVLVNDPGFGSDNDNFFKGETMTYYGRWTYKYEEAARQGAAGVLIIHESVPAGYPWLVVRNSWSGASLYLDNENAGYKCAIQGWISRDAAIEIFETSDADLKNFTERSRKTDFEAISLGVTATLSVDNKIKRDKSQNVIAKIEGEKAPGEVVIYTAHWDHLGIGPEVDGDSIYNGAHDNASGTAAILAIAEAFQKVEKPDRTVVFLAVTAEEQGLLGSKYYAENPIYDPEKTVANLNIDGVASYGFMRDFTIVGYGQSSLDEMAEEIAREQNRYILPDPEPGKGYFFRSDHFNFAKIGIPAMFASGTSEAVKGGKKRVSELSAEYLSTKYHRPADEFNGDEWLFGGIYQDTQLYFQLGYKLTNSEIWPEWKEGSEFKSLRKRQE